ncbi:imidazolonepropionase-like amidohydrolase [Rhizobium sp. BK529]|uniref:amidohydrolase family protein n=1 Tax=Rhizobium sp. BK529 TaxID=2586983 RepID=UPI001621693A|nr:amidohydrolase family protein [Rhizobium sp. BK529]MBB3594811.1 imidazolonepropionase-like amidohydrolase [Rhizobium sp. BK529]
MSQVRPIAIINGSVITGDGVTVLDKASVLLANGRIEAVAEVDPASLSPDYLVLDASGCTILPGVINAHAHGCVIGPSMPSGSPPFDQREVEYQRNRHLLSGTTTLLNVCGLALDNEIDPGPNGGHALDVHISTAHTPASLAAARAVDGEGLSDRHMRARIDDLLSRGAKALGEAGGGQTLGGGAQDYRFLPAVIEKASGLLVHPNLARLLKEATLGRNLDGADNPGGEALARLIEENGLGRHFTVESLSSLIRGTVMPPVALARRGLAEIAAEAARTAMPAIFHTAAPTARQLIDLARAHPTARIVAGHSNHPSFTAEEAMATAVALRGLGASIDVSTLDCISTRWRNEPRNFDVLVEAGLVDTISTDFAGGDWDGILEAVHRLVRKRLCLPAEAIAKATGNVARIFPELAGDRGLITRGKRADIVICHSHNLARVRHVLCAGRIVVSDGKLLSGPLSSQAASDGA